MYMPQAPENLEAVGSNLLTFSDDQSSDGRHRVGWAMSYVDNASLPGTYRHYAPRALDLGHAAGGEIDQHTFRDDDGTTYLIWKTDDNSVGANTTRLWGQRLLVAAHNVSLLGEKHLLLESDGLWWVTSWVAGGSLIEGPEIIKHGDYYYLFFAAGKYCQPSYAEGVARSTSVFGPYEKLSVPLLNTGMAGQWDGQQIVGPGHASFVRNPTSREWFVVYHASKGSGCDRHAFVERLRFSSDGWPYVDFGHDDGGHAAAVGLVEAAEQLDGREAAGELMTSSCRIVAPCEAVDVTVHLGESITCHGKPSRRIDVGGTVPTGAAAPVCALNKN